MDIFQRDRSSSHGGEDKKSAISHMRCIRVVWRGHCRIIHQFSTLKFQVFNCGVARRSAGSSMQKTFIHAVVFVNIASEIVQCVPISIQNEIVDEAATPIVICAIHVHITH